MIYPLGIRFRRAKGIIRFSKEWLELMTRKAAQRENGTMNSVNCVLTKEDFLGLYNCGEYVSDAYRIFVQGDLYAVTTDHALQIYVDYHRGLDKAVG